MQIQDVLLWLLFIIGGFMLGGIMFSRIVPRLVVKEDVCNPETEMNPGATTVFIKCGIPLGLLCLFLDMLKGFIPVFLATFFVDTNSFLFSAVIIAPVLGHAVGLFNGFHGGKSVSTAFGMLLGLQPVTFIGWLLALLFIFFSVVIKINPSRIRNIVSYVIFGVTASIVLIITQKYSSALGLFLMSAIAVVKRFKVFSPEYKNETGVSISLFGIKKKAPAERILPEECETSTATADNKN